MRGEWERAIRFFHEWLGAGGAAARGLQCDGGRPVGALASHLDRTALLRLYNEFFALRWSGARDLALSLQSVRS